MAYTQQPFPSAPPPPDVYGAIPQYKEALIDSFLDAHSIQFEFRQKIKKKVKNCKIILLADDSQSMTLDAYEPEFLEEYNEKIVTKGYPTTQFINQKATRFQELQLMTQCIANAGSILSSDPVSLYFMNRFQQDHPILLRDGVTATTLAPYFAAPAAGLTPTLNSLRRIMQIEKVSLAEKTVILYIATDGAPSDESGQPKTAISNLEKYLAQLMATYPNLHITFMACCSNESLLQTMDKWGEKFARVGVIDQFGVEYKETLLAFVKRSRDPATIREWNYSIGDYITKAMLVSLDPAIKKLFSDSTESSGCSTM